MNLHALDDLDSVTRKKLLEYRESIDGIDGRIAELLTRRTDIVKQVGALKKRSYDPSCYIRPAREAEMLRDIAARFEGSDFPPAAAAAVWRTIIAASTAIESPLALSALENGESPALYWLTREYFGEFSPVATRPTPKLVLSDVLEGRSAAGILPMPSAGPEGGWWKLMLEGGASSLRIFACLPFVLTPHDRFSAPPAVALAKIRPEPTGLDRSLLALDAGEGISQQRLSAFFSGRGEEAEWINITPPESGRRCHLLSVRRFLAAEDRLLRELAEEPSFPGIATILLGSYAEPLYIRTHAQRKER